MNPMAGTPETPTAAKAAREWAALLTRNSQKPVEHWAQGVGNMFQSALGGYTDYKTNEAERVGQQKAVSDLLAALNPTQATPGAFPVQQPVNPLQAQQPQKFQFPEPPADNNPLNWGVVMQDAPQNQSNAPRGLRNNNPGNIEDGPFARNLPGYAGTDGRFAKFASLEAGNAAMDKLLQSYGNRGFNTPESIINRWAPPSDNNPTTSYAGNVAKALGVEPNAILDMNKPEIRQKLMQAITLQENGRVPTAQPAFAPQTVPSAANPASAGVVPPGATPQIDRQALAQIMMNPWASDGIKQFALTQLAPKEPKLQTLREDERLLQVDPRTGRVMDLTPQGTSGPKFERVTSLRKEISDLPEYKRFSTVVPLVKDMVRAANTPGTAGDVSMLYAFAKIMDPESVVREGEYNTLTKLQSLPEQVRGNLQKYINGEASLGPRIRQELMEAAQSRGEELKSSAEQRLGAFSTVIRDNKINPQHVMPHFYDYPSRESLPKLYDRNNPPKQEGSNEPDQQGWTTVDGIKIREKR